MDCFPRAPPSALSSEALTPVPLWPPRPRCYKCPNRPDEAIRIVSRTCQCGMRQPTYAFPGQSRKEARWCPNCPDKPAEAIDVAKKR